MSFKTRSCFATAVVAIFCVTSNATVEAAIRIKDICHVKGQEENTLRGLGLVVGLNGTGDGGDYQPMIRSLGTALQLMGNPIAKSELKREMRDAKNVALVVVEATVPAAGAREGDKLDCHVSSIGAAKSLAGGRLFMAAMKGPKAENARVYAFAQGAVRLTDPKAPTTGKIENGCQLVEEFFNVFATKDGKVTLVLHKYKADFTTAQQIAETISDFVGATEEYREPGARSHKNNAAKALGAVNVVVAIPPFLRDNPVPFVSDILQLPLSDLQTEARVVINVQTGTIAVDGDVEIGSTVIHVNDIGVATGANAAGSRFVPVQAAKLEDLVQALNAVQASPEDKIEIIRALDRTGNLHGHLIIE